MLDVAVRVDDSLQGDGDVFGPRSVGFIVNGLNTARLIVADPHQANRYWATGRGSGVWRSDDGGRSWVPKSNGLINLVVDALEVDPEVPGTLYAAQAFSGGAGAGGVYRTTDHGETWEPMGVCAHTFPTRQFIGDLAVGVHPGPLKTLWLTQHFANSPCGGAFQSDDDGASWCSYNSICAVPGRPPAYPPRDLTCPGGLLDPALNDGIGAEAISGLTEAYYFDSKDSSNHRCRGAYRTAQVEPSLVNWTVDQWLGPRSIDIPRYRGLRRSVVRARLLDASHLSGRLRPRPAPRRPLLEHARGGRGRAPDRLPPRLPRRDDDR